MLFSGWVPYLQQQKDEENLVLLLYPMHFITQPHASFLQCYFTDMGNALISTCPFKQDLTCQYQHTHSHQAHLLWGIHLNVSNCFAMCSNLCSLLSLLRSQHQVRHIISQITKALLEFSGGGIGFFVMHFSTMIARGIQIQDSKFYLPGGWSCANFQLTQRTTITRNCKT